MKNNIYAIPEYATANDIKRVREKLKMTQREFAILVGVSKPTVERWESSTDKINGPIVLLINMIENNIAYLDEIKIPPKEYPLRMFYMHNNNICTLLDINVITNCAISTHNAIIKDVLKFTKFIFLFIFCSS